MIARANANAAIIPIGAELPPLSPRLGRTPKATAVDAKGDSSTSRKAKRGASSGRFKLLRRFWNCDATAKLSHVAQSTWCYLWSLADVRRQCFPSLQRIADRIGCSRRYAQKAVRELIDRGYLSIVRAGSNRGRNRANVYQIAVPRGEP